MFKFFTRIWSAVVEFFFGKKEENNTTETARKEEPVAEEAAAPVFTQEETLTVSYDSAVTSVVSGLEEIGETENNELVARFILNNFKFNQRCFGVHGGKQVKLFADPVNRIVDYVLSHSCVSSYDVSCLADKYLDFYDVEEEHFSIKEIKAMMQEAVANPLYGDDAVTVICKRVMLKSTFENACDVAKYMWLFEDNITMATVINALAVIDAFDFSVYSADVLFYEIGLVNEVKLEDLVERY